MASVTDATSRGAQGFRSRFLNGVFIFEKPDADAKRQSRLADHINARRDKVPLRSTFSGSGPKLPKSEISQPMHVFMLWHSLPVPIK
jgi:hypothetical protein